MSATRWWAFAAVLALLSAAPVAQSVPAARVAILQAEARGALDPRDLATIRSGVRSANSETARTAIRALGRLGRPSLVADIAIGLKSAVAEVRAEGANALADALSGEPPPAAATPSSARARAAAQSSTAAALSSAQSLLDSRLQVEAEPDVRAAICEALGRIPYSDVRQAEHAEAVLLTAPIASDVADRLGVAKGLEALIRTNSGRWTPSAPTISLLRSLLGVVEAPGADANTSTEASPGTALLASAPLRDARVRRLAFEALLTAGAVNDAVLDRAESDPDPQVRRLAMRAAGTSAGSTGAAAGILQAGRRDTSALVRAEALRSESLRGRDAPDTCQHLIESVHDPSNQVGLAAIDLLGDCEGSSDAVDLLAHLSSDPSTASASRGWQRPAHALLALAHAAPARATAALAAFGASSLWPLRAYAARAASVLGDHDTLLKLSADFNDEVARVANAGMGLATPPPAAETDLKAEAAKITAAELQRLAAPRARVSIRDVGTFEVALLTSEAPAAVLRFVRLAEAGRFDQTTIAAVLPTRIDLPMEPESGRANEIGAWPHVRGTMGVSRDASGSIFIDLVDSPGLDHKSPVFAQVLNGKEILDEILEGDVIERVEILSGP